MKVSPAELIRHKAEKQTFAVTHLVFNDCAKYHPKGDWHWQIDAFDESLLPNPPLPKQIDQRLRHLANIGGIF